MSARLQRTGVGILCRITSGCLRRWEDLWEGWKEGGWSAAKSLVGSIGEEAAREEGDAGDDFMESDAVGVDEYVTGTGRTLEERMKEHRRMVTNVNGASEVAKHAIEPAIGWIGPQQRLWIVKRGTRDEYSKKHGGQNGWRLTTGQTAW